MLGVSPALYLFFHLVPKRSYNASHVGRLCGTIARTEPFLPDSVVLFHSPYRSIRRPDNFGVCFVFSLVLFFFLLLIIFIRKTESENNPTFYPHYENEMVHPNIIVVEKMSTNVSLIIMSLWYHYKLRHTLYDAPTPLQRGWLQGERITMAS